MSKYRTISTICFVNSEGFPCRSISSLGALGEGSGWDLRVCPAAPAGNLGFCPLGIEVEKQGFRTAWFITGQKFQGVGLKLTAFILTVRDPSSHLWQKNMRMAESGDLDFGSCSIFHTPFFAGI